MVHFPALSSSTYGFSRGYPGISRGGFPHSEISGSKPVCGSPKLIAAYHVLHRLLVPRHPPYALSSLTSNPQELMPSVLGAWANPGTKDLVHQNHRYTACVLWSEKLPFAGYSVVKDQLGPAAPNPAAAAPRGPLHPTPRPRGAHVRALAPSPKAGSPNSVTGPAQSGVRLRIAPVRRRPLNAGLWRTAFAFWLASQPKLVAPATSEGWWRIPGSNRCPPGCKPGALPAELIPHHTRSTTSGHIFRRQTDATAAPLLDRCLHERMQGV